MSASLSSDVQLPPYARRLDVRATRAAFAAGTLSTVGDDVAREDGERYVVLRDANRNDADDVKHELLTERGGKQNAPVQGGSEVGRFAATAVIETDCEAYAPRSVSSFADHEPREWYDEAERLRQSRLRRWQTIR